MGANLNKKLLIIIAVVVILVVVLCIGGIMTKTKNEKVIKVFLESGVRENEEFLKFGEPVNIVLTLQKDPEAKFSEVSNSSKEDELHFVSSWKLVTHWYHVKKVGSEVTVTHEIETLDSASVLVPPDMEKRGVIKEFTVDEDSIFKFVD